MSPTRLLLACAIAAAATVAHADPVYSVSAPSGDYVLPTSFTLVGFAGVETVSDSWHLAPAGLAAGSPYLYTSYDYSSITVDVNASSFAFLWGSPDTYNTLTLNTSAGTFVYTGTMLQEQFGLPANTASTAFAATLAGGTINTAVFTSSDIAFEFAVAAAVPEPETYALMFGGLLAIGFMVRRKG